MKSEDKLKIEMHGTWTAPLFSSFQMLYVPLIGNEVASLYQLLIALYESNANIKNHRILHALTKQSAEKMEKNRHILEQYLLLKTYYNGLKNAYIYQLYMPKDGHDFLRHEVFGRLYIKEFGKQVYEFQKISFSKDVEVKDEYKEITLPFENVLEENWKEQQEEQFLSLKPDQTLQSRSEMPLHFNYDRFLSSLSHMILPGSERSEKNLRIIGELATIHGINEDDMKKLVAQSMDLKKNTLNVETLKRKVRNSKTSYAKETSNPYALPPVRFLQQKQHGISVTKSDKQLIESLIYDYKMSPEVVNVLLEFVLDKTNQKLTKSYVEKVAATWIRLTIDTYEKALEHIASEQEKATKSRVSSDTKKLPDWYKHQEEEDIDFDEKVLEENLRKLRGE